MSRFEKATFAVALSGAAIGGVALAGCGNSAPKESIPFVEAVVANAPGTGASAQTNWGNNHQQNVYLASGTKITAECTTGGSPYGIGGVIESGPYKGRLFEGVLRTFLHNTTDPYHAAEQQPSQDPFGPLPPCR